MRINIGPGPHYQEGWTNVDVEQVRDIFRADVYVEDPMVLPFEDDSADEFYLAHILEHIPWEDVPTYITEVYRVLKPGGKAIIIGPDLIRGLELWKQGKLQRDFTDSDPGLLGMLEWANLPGWEAPRHYWNSEEKRILSLLKPSEWDAIPVDISSKELDPYPVVSRAPWQCAIIARKK